MAHPSFQRTAHRPWALPTSPWVWRQSWRDLLFAHWPVEASVLQRFVPSPLRVQEFDGTSWIGLVPFRMAGVMRRPWPDLPWMSAFPELNVRLYVELDGKPGVWFLSLDATNPLAVWAARRYFHLPYHSARISLHGVEGGIRYSARRTSGHPALEATYRAISSPYESRQGTLEHWLTERYCLYAQTPDGVILRNDVHHVPWPLQRAEAEITENSYFAAHGLDIGGPPALLHAARRIDVVVWNAERAL
ncbi:MAG TPA: DUF2071 domain-containing protein [Holophagaceae bacterium]|nr:DUF2071 domain-containing protein [Holophagaceae bacterium]